MIGFEKDKSGGRTLLFDKLTDNQPEVSTETPVALNYSREGLFASIKREVSDLLNCRCKLPWSKYKDVKDIPYGTPDLYGMLATSAEDKKGAMGAREVCRSMEKAIALFEPRLQDVSVSAKKVHASFGYTLEVSGEVLVAGKAERVFFPVDIDTHHSSKAAGEETVYNTKESALKWPKDRADYVVDKT